MDDNTAIGYQALLNNRNGTRNTVAKNFALQNNTTGNDTPPWATRLVAT
jgi:hypothetical protein